jgi:dUTP pyrophosphatase
MERILIPTGLIFCCSDDENVSGDINTYSIRLYARSGMALKRGLTLVNSVGIVDVDYQEEVFVPLINLSRQNQVIKHKERICQAEIVQNVRFSAVESLHKLERLSERIGGFGSTGS